MPESINYSINVDVGAGPKLTVKPASPLQVEAYDKLQLVLADADAPTVELQPVADKVSLLLVTSSEYGAGLEYDLGSGTFQTLEAPLFLVGVGNVKQTGNGKQLKLKNGLGHTVTVQVLVGREAIA